MNIDTPATLHTLHKTATKLGAAMLFAGSQLLFAGSAFAATQGNLGATSNASVAIAASVPARARLSGLTDIALAGVNPASNAVASRNLCAWSNTASKGYRITASGSGSASAFTLSSGSLTVPYTVQWNQAAGQTSGVTLTPSTASATFTSLATHHQCLTGPTASASLVVTITSAALQTMQANTTYSGTLTLLMTPQSSPLSG